MIKEYNDGLYTMFYWTWESKGVWYQSRLYFTESNCLILGQHAENKQRARGEK